MDANANNVDNGHNTQHQDDIGSLRKEIFMLHRALRLQSAALAKEQSRATGLAKKLSARDNSVVARQHAQDRQAATLLRALLVLEASMKREQASIKLRLASKDNEIRRLRESKAYCKNCRQAVGFTSEQTNIETDPEFHSLDSIDSHHNKKIFERSLSYQPAETVPFQKNSRLSKSFQLPKNNNSSSSEEVCESGEINQNKGTYVKNKQSFVRKDATRRSRKYSARKHSSAYLETVQKRRSSSSEDMQVQSEKDPKFCPEGDVGEEISKDIERASNRIDKLLNENKNGLINDSLQLNHQRRTMSFGTKMESLHGIKTNNFNSGDQEKPWYNNSSDPEPDLDYAYTPPKERLIHRKSISADNILNVGENIMENKHFPSPASSEKRNIYDDVNSNGSLYSKNHKYDNIDGDSNQNWYASASDQDDDGSCEIYKNNPVLECVNQILLQNSLDESACEQPRSFESASPKTSCNNTKRVQFSTLNSISFDDSIMKNGGDGVINLPKPTDRRNGNRIVKFSLETASEHSYEVPITSEGFNYEVQSIYSNDYEPIITKPVEKKDITTQNGKLKPVPLPRTINAKENQPKTMSLVKNMAKNLENKLNGSHYVDMENKYDIAKGGTKKPRTPPALPPKPKNLVSKFKINGVVINNNANSEAVAQNQRLADVHTHKTKTKKSHSSASESDYCSISEINVPVVSSGRRNLILSQASVEIHTEQFAAERKPSTVPKMATISKIPHNNNKISDRDIPKLPQVTEIIIPDEDDSQTPSNRDSMKSNSAKMDLRNSSIQMGHSVSSILTDIKNRNGDIKKCILSPESKFQQAKTAPIFEECDKFDLSQNFEEFKIDECEFTAEEYKIGSEGSEEAIDDENSQVLLEASKINNEIQKKSREESPYRIEFTAEDNLGNTAKNYSKMSNKPDLLSNIDNVESESVRYSDLESSNSSSSNCGSYNTVKEAPAPNPEKSKSGVPFEYFLESSGLSSKSILTPSRPPNSNHKSVLKPKDIKSKSKSQAIGRATPLLEKCSNTSIKYFEPYL